MTSLRIRVHETRVALPRAPEGAASDLVVDVPDEPIKANRGTVVFAWPPAGAQRLIVKVYGEMGVLNWLRKQVVGYRARREFQALARLRAAGIDCCEPMFWGTGRSPEYGLFEVLATRELHGMTTLAERVRRLGAAERVEVLGQAFEQLSRVHRAGFFHGAFYLSNVLVSAVPDSPPRLWLIDLEKSVFFAHDVRGSRMADQDLVNAMTSTFHVLGGRCPRRAVARYGFDDARIARAYALTKAFRSSKFLRYRRRIEFLARGVLSRAWHGDAAAGVPASQSREDRASLVDVDRP